MPPPVLMPVTCNPTRKLPIKSVRSPVGFVRSRTMVSASDASLMPLWGAGLSAPARVSAANEIASPPGRLAGLPPTEKFSPALFSVMLTTPG